MKKILITVICSFLGISAMANTDTNSSEARPERSSYVLILVDGGMIVDGKSPEEQCFEKLQNLARIEHDSIRKLSSTAIPKAYITSSTSDWMLAEMIHTGCVDSVIVNNPEDAALNTVFM